MENMVNNLICEKCDKEHVCRLKNVLLKLNDDSEKKRLGIDVTMDRCENFAGKE